MFSEHCSVCFSYYTQNRGTFAGRPRRVGSNGRGEPQGQFKPAAVLSAFICKIFKNMQLTLSRWKTMSLRKTFFPANRLWGTPAALAPSCRCSRRWGRRDYTGPQPFPGPNTLRGPAAWPARLASRWMERDCPALGPCPRHVRQPWSLRTNGCASEAALDAFLGSPLPPCRQADVTAHLSQPRTGSSKGTVYASFKERPSSCKEKAVL